MERINVCEYQSPCGLLLLGELDGQLCMCDWIASRRHDNNLGRLRHSLKATINPLTTSLLEKTANELDEFFQRRRQVFDIPLLMAGTDFQKRVWQSLLSIPYSTTTTYGELAQAIGCPRSVRAVAAAVGANPMSIIVPCHRVIGHDNALTGYAGGLAAKRFLLALEHEPQL